MSPFRSALYPGVVVHTRLKPRRHRLRYGVPWMLVDLDELPALVRRHRLFAWNRPGLLAFHDRDHGARDGSPLRPWAERKLQEAGIAPGGGRIELLCMPRILNHVFNPLSVWFCRAREGEIQAVIWEVNNTFGQTHSYVLPVAEPASAVIDQHCPKAFHVSPLMPADLTYRFRVIPPEATTTVTIHAHDRDGAMLAASFSGARRELSDRALFGAWLSHPLLSLKVLGAIHWEALRIWLKLWRAPQAA